MTTRLYALGSNSSGQLGIGHRQDVDLPTLCQIISPSSSRAGSIDAPCNDEWVKSKISPVLESHVQKIVAGGNHTLVLCIDGAVYAAGSREALGTSVELVSRYAGHDDSGTHDLAAYFIRVMWWEGEELLDTFTNISATWTASFFVVAPPLQDGRVVGHGQIYVCGKGEKGELGLGKDIVETERPRRLASFGSCQHSGNGGDFLNEVPLIQGTVAEICSSVSHTLIRSTGRDCVCGWGACRKGQLGNSVKEERVLWKPVELAREDISHDQKIEWVCAMAAGRDFTLLQGVCGELGGQIRKFTLLGGHRFLDGDRDDVKRFLAGRNVPMTAAEQMPPNAYSSWSNIYFLDIRSQVVTGLGRNDHGQLPPAALPKLRTIAVGSEHCVGLTDGGKVVTWGWGEHGNCGRRTDDTGQGWSLLDPLSSAEEEPTGIGAGCATTFVWTLQR